MGLGSTRRACARSCPAVRSAPSRSSISRTSRTRALRPNFAAAPAAASERALFVLAWRRRATRERLGTASARSSTCLVTISSYCEASPVMFPPGCARLVTRPTPTGSIRMAALTIGMVVVAFWTARRAGDPEATITSTLRRTNSTASPGRRSAFPSAQRCSMRRFCPSSHPRSRRPCRNASNSGSARFGAPFPMTPMRAAFLPACWASAASGAARRPPAKVPMKVRRSITRSADPPAAGATAGS